MAGMLPRGVFCRAQVVLALSCGAAVGIRAQSHTSLAALTVPENRLPAGCHLKPIATPEKPTLVGGTHVVTADPSSYPSNPWSGTTTRWLVETRNKIDAPPPPVVDAPVTASETNAINSERVAHVVEAYRALYDSADDASVEVVAIKFDDPTLAIARPAVTREMRGGSAVDGRIVKGVVVVKVLGSATTGCFKAINAYVRAWQ